MELTQAALLSASAFVAGAINSIAGGGSLVSFPAAVALGLSPLVANATNTVALFPGSFASALAYRREIAKDGPVLKLLFPASTVGGVAGAGLLLITPQHIFDALVPLLVLFATALLFVQNLRPPKPASAHGEDDGHPPRRKALIVVAQLFVGLYGGYFGAGIGIMMLALLGRLGGTDIHRMNGVKSILAVAINMIAAMMFIAAGAVAFRPALIMMAGAVVGGYFGARIARRVKPSIVRWAVVAIGLALAIKLAHRRWG